MMTREDARFDLRRQFAKDLAGQLCDRHACEHGDLGGVVLDGSTNSLVPDVFNDEVNDPLDLLLLEGVLEDRRGRPARREFTTHGAGEQAGMALGTADCWD